MEDADNADIDVVNEELLLLSCVFDIVKMVVVVLLGTIICLLYIRSIAIRIIV